VPPLTSLGKTEMAFDLGSGIDPGAAAGNALLNAHTWPDGSALGNKLLAGLQQGDQIVVHGLLGQICYRVTDRVEVPADDPGIRYFAKTGSPQIAIIVCSGQRLGPGVWTKRTIWYASPTA
jgi:sortase (surface protein transpeptidase)